MDIRPQVKDAMMECLNFPDDLKYLRETLGISQAELARQLGYTRSDIWAWEHGRCYPKDNIVLVLVLNLAKSLRGTNQPSIKKGDDQQPA